jgi:3-hydroxybutyryl-CoA dehydrogenase
LTFFALQLETAMSKSIESILIVGAGWIGRQIAAQCASHGLLVTIWDKQADVGIDAVHWAIAHASKLSQEGLWVPDASRLCEQRIRAVANLDQVSENIDLALECVTEQSSAKRRALSELSARFDQTTIIASNSSYFTPSMLSKYVAYPERFCHFHFHAPIWLATIVDIAPGPEAAPEILERLKKLAIRIGQTPIVQTVENPGYIFNALLQNLLSSSLDLAQRGVAIPADIDLSWKTVTGMRVGPFGMMDWIGIDLIQQVLTNARWLGDYEKTQKLIDYLQPWIDRGELGVKSGQGFFQYKSTETESNG